MEPERNVYSEDGQWEEQLWYSVQFDEDSPPVMMAIEDPSFLDNEEQKEALIDSAWDFHCRGVWARENSNPQFIRNLAGIGGTKYAASTPTKRSIQNPASIRTVSAPSTWMAL
jgi:hypothetical protein